MIEPEIPRWQWYVMIAAVSLVLLFIIITIPLWMPFDMVHYFMVRRKQYADKIKGQGAGH